MSSSPFQPISDPFETHPLGVKRQKVHSSPDPHLTTTPVTSTRHGHLHHHHLEACSVPPSPYPGLSEKQIKRLEREFKKTDSKIEFAKGLLAMSGCHLPKEDVIEWVAKWTDQAPDVRTYSVLTSQDFEKLCSYIKNFMHVNDYQLSQSIPDKFIPSSFLSMLRISRLVSSRRNEMGTRKIINIFLDVAVYIARQIFHEERLVVHQEYDTAPTEVPEIGIVSGPLDYVTSRAAGNADMGKFSPLWRN